MAKRVGFDDGPEDESGLAKASVTFLINCFIDLFKRAFALGGRTPQRVFWVQFTILSLILIAIWQIRVPAISPGGGTFLMFINLSVFYLLITIIIRRTHDVGESAWASFNFLAGIFLAFQYLKLFIYPGDLGDNKYGPDFEFAKPGKDNDPKRIG